MRGRCARLRRRLWVRLGLGGQFACLVDVSWVRGGDWRVVVVWVGLGWDGGCDHSASLEAIKVAVIPTAQEKQNDHAPTNVILRRGGPGGIVSRAELLSC